LHPNGKKLYLGLFSTGVIDTPLVVHDLGPGGMPTARPPRAYAIHEPITHQFACSAVALHPTGRLLYAIGRRSWGLAVFKLDPEGEPIQEGAFVTDEIVQYGGVSLGFLPGDGRSRADKLVIGSLILGPPDTPTMRTIDLNKEGLPVGLQTQEYKLANATSVFDPGYASLTVGPQGVYYRTQDAGLGYHLFGSTVASSGEGKMALGKVQTVGTELMGGDLLVALDHAFNDTHKDAQGNPLKQVDGFSLQRVSLGPDGRPAQVISPENALIGKQCKLLVVTPTPVGCGSPITKNMPTVESEITVSEITVGGNGQDGKIRLVTKDGQISVEIKAAYPEALRVVSPDGKEQMSITRFGVTTAHGILNVAGLGSVSITGGMPAGTTIEPHGTIPSILVGYGRGTGGLIGIANAQGKEAIILDGASEKIQIADDQGNVGVTIDGRVVPGQRMELSPGGITLFNNNNNVGGLSGSGMLRCDGPLICGKASINGADGNISTDGTIECFDVHLRNGDCAEEFDLEPGSDADAGSVLVLTEEGRVTPCTTDYDTRVAGVMSGAGAYKPGLVLDRKGTSEGRVPVTLMGKVFCKVDATTYPLRAGDLLTTSSLPGHAMRACSRARMPGAIIGKALRGLAQGRALVPILLALG
jgi:hypothetical protein